jgi:hypothetical protein
MAVANVAVCLYRRGARVLVIDWDLEAPGIENFFFESESQLQDVKSQLGVIDLLLDYRQRYSLVASAADPSQQSLESGKIQSSTPVKPFDRVAPHLLPVRNFLYPIYLPQSPTDKRAAGLWLLPSGWRTTGRKEGGSQPAGRTSKDDRFSRYAEAVQSFDWADFYTQYDGESYFKWFRDQLLPFPAQTSEIGDDRLGFDAVLIDSRTGVTEMGGVCTRQLADVVVSFCAPNYQNLDGVARMSESFVREDLRKLRGGRLPEVVVVPARVDLQGETNEQNSFRQKFEDKLQSPLAYAQIGMNMWDLLIPYVTKYAYRETLTVGVKDSNKTLEKAYVDLTTRLALLADPDSNLRIFFARDLEALKTTLSTTSFGEPPVSIQGSTGSFASLLAGFTSDQVIAARRVLTRLVNVSSNTRLAVQLDDIPEGDRGIVDRLVATGVLKASTNKATGKETIELANDALIQHWPQLRDWLEEDREFLLWRQRLDSTLSAWKDTGKDSEALLPRSLMGQAKSWLNKRQDDLTREEIAFIEASQSRAKGLGGIVWKVASSMRFRTIVYGSIGALATLFFKNLQESSSLYHYRFTGSSILITLVLSFAAGAMTLTFEGKEPVSPLKSFILGASFVLILGLLSTSVAK